jgi:hypothetical protein
MHKLIWTVAVFYIVGGGTIGFIGAFIAGLTTNEIVELLFVTWLGTSVILAVILGKLMDHIR